jgi:hypothetical protein
MENMTKKIKELSVSISCCKSLTHKVELAVLLYHVFANPFICVEPTPLPHQLQDKAILDVSNHMMNLLYLMATTELLNVFQSNREAVFFTIHVNPLYPVSKVA